MKTLSIYQKVKAVAVFMVIFFTLNTANLNAANQNAATDTLTIKQKTENVIKAFERDDFDAIVVYFDETMKAAMPSDNLRTVWAQVSAAVGKFQKADLDNLRETRVENYNMIVVPFSFEKGNLNFRLVFNEDGTIGGMQFLPAN